MKRVVVIAIITVFFVSLIAGMQLKMVKSNFIVHCQEFVINSDGSITPSTELLVRSKDTYYLTANTSNCSFTIKRSNIMFDGQNHVIDGGIGSFGYSNVGLNLNGLTNITIRDVAVKDFWSDNIALIGCSNCTILRVQTQGNQPLRLQESTNNNIAQSNISQLDIMTGSNNNSIAQNRLEILHVMGNQNIINKNNVASYFFPSWGSNNLFYENNFYNIHVEFDNLKINYWDNGSKGNYWSNYGHWTNYSRYDTNGDGIGDSPYIIDQYNQDNCPLMFPINFTEPANPILTPSPTVALPTAIPTTLPTPTPTFSPIIIPTSSPTQFIEIGHKSDDLTYKIAIALIGITAIAIAAGVGVIAYFKKRRG